MKAFKIAAASLGLALVASTVFAHHSTSGIYDQTADIELKGVVKEWRFVNPHPSLKLTVVDDKGASHDWDISYGGSAVTHLKRRGYGPTTFKIGDQIIVKGNPTLAPGTYGLLVERSNPTRADGSALLPPNPGPGAGPAPAP